MDDKHHTHDTPTDHIANALRAFAPIRLDQMANVTLLDRVDIKYVISLDQLMAALMQVQDDYRVLSIGGNRLNRYQTVYFDTPDFTIYHQHHNGCSDRYKVRTRRYVESDMMFFEVKHRTSRNRTLKSRVPMSGAQTRIDSDAENFLGTHSPYHAGELEPKLRNDYQRTTLVSKTHEERVTIDLNVAFERDSVSRMLDGLAIVEIKQAHRGQPSVIIPQLRRLGARPASFSKYCAGVAMLYENVKRNNFKAQMRQLDKLVREENSLVRFA